MGSRRSRKAKAREVIVSQVEEAISSIHYDSAQRQKQEPKYRHSCTYCPSWTRCVGYVQHQECERLKKAK